MMPISSSSPLSSLTFNAINRYTNTSKTVSFEALPIMRNEPSSYCSFNNIGGEQEYLYTDVDELNDSDSETYWQAEPEIRGGFTSHCAFQEKGTFLLTYKCNLREIAEYANRRNTSSLGRRVVKARLTRGPSRVLKQTWAEDLRWHRALWSCGLQVCSAGDYVGHCTLICSHKQHYRERRDKDTRFQFNQ